MVVDFREAETGRCRVLLECCENPRVYVHLGGHTASYDHRVRNPELTMRQHQVRLKEKTSHYFRWAKRKARREKQLEHYPPEPPPPIQEKKTLQ